MIELGNRGPRDGWMLVALAAWSGRCFFRHGGTAYEWPAVDMAPLVARQLDPTFLANDFFTSASSEPNPRHVFGFLVATLARCFGDDWYAALFMLRVIAAFFLPVLWYLVLTGFVRTWFARDEREELGERSPLRHDESKLANVGRIVSVLVVVAGLAVVVRPNVAALFSIAWWSPFHPLATPSTYSLMFALCGSALLLRPARWRAAAGMLAWIAASLLHPAVSLFVILFHGIATFDRWRVSSAAAILVVGWILPCAALAIAFRPTVSLPTDEFIRLYVIARHPSHYWPSAFGSLTAKPWRHSFFLLVGLMLATMPYAAWRRDRRLAILSLSLTAAYVGCVGLQYVAVVAWPTKQLAMLGPVRYSSLGFFAWLLLAAIVAFDAATHAASRWQFANSNSKSIAKPVLARLFLPRRSALALMALASVYVGVTARDDPFEAARQTQHAFYDWIAENSPPDAVFATADDHLSIDLALVGNRAVFTGTGFPFREDFFVEFAYRDSLIFGTKKQHAAPTRITTGDTDPKRAFFRNLGPRDFVRIAQQRQLDYVIVEANHAGHFAAIAPDYANPSWHVYAIDALRKAAARR